MYSKEESNRIRRAIKTYLILRERIDGLSREELGKSIDWRRYNNVCDILRHFRLSGLDVIDIGLGDVSEERNARRRLLSKLEGIKRSVDGEKGELAKKIRNILESKY